MDTLNLTYPMPASQTPVQVYQQQSGRLLGFIRQQLPDLAEAEDLMQEVFEELVNSYRLPESIEQTTAWLYTVARNRIVDRFRKKRPVNFSALVPSTSQMDEDAEALWLEQLLPVSGDNPEDDYLRSEILDVISQALELLPQAQRDVFIAHEVEGLKFSEIAEKTGVSINTLLAQKHYAVKHLRVYLQKFYEEYTL